MGIPLRLDSVRRDPDRNYRGGRRGVRSIPVRSRAVHIGDQLPDSAHSHLHGLCVLTLHGATSGCRRDRAADMDQLARAGIRQDRAERLHHGQGFRDCGADPGRPVPGPQLGGDPYQFHLNLRPGRIRSCAGRRGRFRIRTHRRDRRSAVRLAVFGRRLA